MTSYDELAPFAPPGKLELMLDQKNQGDRHLSLIADRLDGEMMENSLCPVLNIKANDIRDISRQYRENPKRMRCGHMEYTIELVITEQCLKLQ